MLQGHRGAGRGRGDQGHRADLEAAAPEVAERECLSAARAARQADRGDFLGADPKTVEGGNLTAASDAGRRGYFAAALAKAQDAEARAVPSRLASVPKLEPGQKYIRGLYSGGTFCYEASLLLSEALSPVYSNTPVGRAAALDDVWKSQAHTLVDLGDDVFTRGRPHPMIDHRLRNERIAKEAADPETAVILLDVVLGYGSHHGPGRRDRPGHRSARGSARATAGRELAFVGFVCGTDGDPQDLAAQEAALREAGMMLARSNAQAVRLAAGLVEHVEQAAGEAAEHEMTLFNEDLQVVNVGLASFAEAIVERRRQGQSRSTGRRRGRRRRGRRALARLVNHPAVEAANRKAYAAYLARSRSSTASGSPKTAIPGMGRRMILHAGPPIAWAQMCGPMQGAIVGAILYRGLGADDAERAQARRERRRSTSRPATTTARSGRWPASSARRCRCGSCATASDGNRTFSNLNEGLGKALRFGANGPEVLDALKWMADQAAQGARRRRSKSPGRSN